MKRVVGDFDSYEYFKRLAVENTIPFAIEIDVTNKCNANCFFCFQGSHNCENDNLTLHDYIKLFDELKELGCYSLGFSGGEPFCREDFLDILGEAKRRGFRVSLITNAHKITGEDVNIIESLGVERITVSFHSLNLDNYNYHFGIKDQKDCYDNALSVIKECKKRGISTGIAITVTNKNINEIDSMIAYFMGLGFDKHDINLNSLLQGSRAVEEHRPSELLLEESKVHFTNCAEGFLCSAGIISCSISWDGNVYPCTFFNTSAGNIKNDSFKNIWGNSHYLKFFRSIKESFFEKCNSCAIKSCCNVCLASNLNETGNPFEPSLGYCMNKKILRG